MKIVDIAEFYSDQGGGVKTYINQKMEAARAAGHTLTVLAPGSKTYCEERDGGQIWWIKSWQIPVDKRYYLFTSAADAHKVLDDIQPDVVEASSTWRGAWIAASWPGNALKALVLHQEPVSVYPHSLLDNVLSAPTIDRLFFWFWAYLRRVEQQFDISVVSGAWLANRFAHFGMRRPKDIPFGIKKQDFSPDKRDDSLRARILKDMGLDPEAAKLIVNVSRHHPEKRLKTVFRGICQANEKRPFGLIQIGDGPFTKGVQKAAENMPHIRLEGFVKDRATLSRLLASSDAMMHGGAAETYGIVLAEGLCSGLPLITPSAGGAFDMSGQAYSETYKTGDAADAARALLALFDRDEGDLRQNAQAAAQQKILTHEQHFERLFDYYEECISQKNKNAIA